MSDPFSFGSFTPGIMLARKLREKGGYTLDLCLDGQAKTFAETEGFEVIKTPSEAGLILNWKEYTNALSSVFKQGNYDLLVASYTYLPVVYAYAHNIKSILIDTQIDRAFAADIYNHKKFVENLHKFGQLRLNEGAQSALKFIDERSQYLQYYLPRIRYAAALADRVISPQTIPLPKPHCVKDARFAAGADPDIIWPGPIHDLGPWKNYKNYDINSFRGKRTLNTIINLGGIPAGSFYVHLLVESISKALNEAGSTFNKKFDVQITGGINNLETGIKQTLLNLLTSEITTVKEIKQLTWTDYVEAISNADLTFVHPGYNSIGDAIYNRRPFIITMPYWDEQHRNATITEAQELGRVIMWPDKVLRKAKIGDGTLYLHETIDRIEDWIDTDELISALAGKTVDIISTYLTTDVLMQHIENHKTFCRMYDAKPGLRALEDAVGALTNS